MELVGGYPGFIERNEFLQELKTFLKGSKFERNYWFFTLFWIMGGTLFYALYFRAHLNNKWFRSIIGYGIGLFLLFSIGYLLMNPDIFFKGRTVPIDVLGVIIIMLAVMFYLVEMLRSDSITTFYKSINFYIAATLIIWYLTVTPLSFYNMYFSKADWSFVILKYQIHLFANICMYLTFTFALLCCKPKND
jgi:hypothetical protein